MLLGPDAERDVPVPFIKTRLRKNKSDNGRNQIIDILTPIANSKSLLVARVEHGADDHESGCNRAFAYTQDEAADEKTSEVLACCMAAKRNGPNEYVNAARRRVRL